MTKLRETEVAWAAGFFDGDGNARVDRSRQPVVQFQQLDREVLERFRLAVGFGKVLGPYGPYEGQLTSKQIFCYRVRGEDAICVLECIRPYVSKMKLPQVEAALSASR